jgi:hypothetical protein
MFDVSYEADTKKSYHSFDRHGNETEETEKAATMQTDVRACFVPWYICYLSIFSVLLCRSAVKYVCVFARLASYRIKNMAKCQTH